MNKRTNHSNTAVVLLLTVALFAFVGVISHGCSATEYGEIKLERINVTPALSSIYSGATVTFKAEGVYSDTTKKDLTSKVVWQSSGTEVTIDPATGIAKAGDVTANYDCTITATYNGVKGSAKMTIKVPAFVSISISAQSGTSIAQQTSVQFTATGTLDDNSTQDVTSKVTWASDAPAVLEIDATGKATGKSGGSAQVTATIAGLTSNAVSVTVSNASLTALTIQSAVGGSPTIAETETVQFTATGTFSDGNSQDMTASVTWSTSNTAVATISAAGHATAVSTNGTTVIKATFGGIISNEVTLTASGAALVSIEIVVGGVQGMEGTIPANAQKPVTAEATYSSGPKKTVTMEVDWTSSNPAVGQIVKTASTVEIKGLNAGTSNLMVTITISLNGKTDSAEFTVTPIGGN